jgi:hypothetical protein
VTYRVASVERRAREDKDARKQLAAITNAFHQVGLFLRREAEGKATLNQAHQLAADIRQTVFDARAALLTAGITYHVSYPILRLTEALADGLETDDRSQLEGASNDVVACHELVNFLMDLLDHRRGYRRSRRARVKLNRKFAAILQD